MFLYTLFFLFFLSNLLAQESASSLPNSIQKQNNWNYENRRKSTTNNPYASERLQSTSILLDSINGWRFDSTTMVWNASSRSSYLYDANDNQISELSQVWSGGAWVNSELSTTTYNANNSRTSYLTTAWNGFAWAYKSLDSFTYDSNNEQTRELYRTWEGSGWVNSLQFINTYDAKKNVTNFLDQEWKQSAWVNTQQNTYTFDGNNNCSLELISVWSDTGWTNLSLSIYKYDANNNRTRDSVVAWRVGAWANSSLLVYTFDVNNNLTSFLFQEWNRTLFVNSALYTFTYDSNNRNKSLLYQTWNDTGWVNNFKDSNASDSNLESQLRRIWDGNKYVRSDSIIRYYHQVAASVAPIIGVARNLTIYPNPSSGDFTVIFPNIGRLGIVEVYTVLGEKIFGERAFLSSKVEIRLNNIPNGIYFVKAYDGNNYYTQKIIIGQN
ncbi:MAG: T9SS type A sorting domain-containing protein [Bacteroidota bacterium]|nr:T9SS type A sorting domain-containing protein [Bacteroidota bacterium]MDP4235338.1 T9SS type A sorting domain-containing protein [Bacteroidota bacterium]